MPVKADSAIIFAPAGELVPPALRALEKGGTLALAGIHMTDIPGYLVDALVEFVPALQEFFTDGVVFAHDADSQFRCPDLFLGRGSGWERV